MSSEVDVNLTLALRRVAEVLRAGHRPPHHQRHWTKLQVKQHVAQGAIHAEKVLLKVPSDEDDLGSRGRKATAHVGVARALPRGKGASVWPQ
ncbi:MAG TPA: hypothetical protein VMU41_01190 [Candidatus Binataceae bacterium]|nr:hypothetical protein [Candidatus Binataceae bacterium]